MLLSMGIAVAVGAFVAGFLVGDATRPIKVVEKAPDVGTLIRWRTHVREVLEEAGPPPCALGLTTCPRFHADDAAQCVVNAGRALEELAAKVRALELPGVAPVGFRDAHGRFTKAPGTMVRT